MTVKYFSLIKYIKYSVIVGCLGFCFPVLASTLPGNNQLVNIFVNDPTTLFNQFTKDFPINITLNPGALGLTNPNTYLQQLLQPIRQIKLTTPFSLGGGQNTLTGTLQNIDFNEEPFLFDVAVDGEVILTGQGNNGFSENVVLPSNLLDNYYRNGISNFVKAGGIKGGLSEVAQQKILDVLTSAYNTENDNQNQANDSIGEANNSNTLLSGLDNSSFSNDYLASQSDTIASYSQSTDTSFQILLNISSQLGIQSRQTAHSSTQFTRLGEILSNQSAQLAQQSQQFHSQQKTATQLLEAAKQEQFLESMQTVTQAEQLKLLSESVVEQNRLSQAPINQSSTLNGVIILPLNNQ